MTDAWVDLDISAAVQLGTPPWGQYSDGVIWTNGGYPDFYWPSLVLDGSTWYEFEVTWDPASPHDSGSRYFLVGAALTGSVVSDYNNASGPYDYNGLYSGFHSTDYPADEGFVSADVLRFLVGPGRHNFDTDIAAGRTTPIFESGNTAAVSGMRYRVVTFTTTTGTVSATTSSAWTPVNDADSSHVTGGGTVWEVVSGSSVSQGHQTMPFDQGSGTVPADAEFTGWRFFCTIKGDGTVGLDPELSIQTPAHAGSNIADYGGFGGGGPGDIIGGNNTPHAVVYSDTSGGGTIPDPAGLWAALAAAPANVYVTSTAQGASTGAAAVFYDSGASGPKIELDWTLIALDPGPDGGAATVYAPPLRLTNRDDIFSSAPSLTRSRSQQGSNRLTAYL